MRRPMGRLNHLLSEDAFPSTLTDLCNGEGENTGCGDYRSCQGSASGFVDAGNDGSRRCIVIFQKVLYSIFLLFCSMTRTVR